MSWDVVTDFYGNNTTSSTGARLLAVLPTSISWIINKTHISKYFFSHTDMCGYRLLNYVKQSIYFRDWEEDLSKSKHWKVKKGLILITHCRNILAYEPLMYFLQWNIHALLLIICINSHGNNSSLWIVGWSPHNILILVTNQFWCIFFAYRDIAIQTCTWAPSSCTNLHSCELHFLLA